MKKFSAVTIIISIILIAVMSINISAAYSANDMSAYGQETVQVYLVETPPVLDGIVAPSEYNEAVRVLKYGDKAVYFNGEGFTEAEKDYFLPSEFYIYAAYDDDYLYIAAVNNDNNHYTPLTGTGVWDGDYLEFDFGSKVSADWNDMTDKLRLAIGKSSADGSICTYSALNQTDAKEQFDTNIDLEGIATVSVENGLTTYEAHIPWTYITPDGKAPVSAFFYYQLGIADEAYADRSDYEAYLGVYRYAILQDDDMKNETNTGVIAHIMKFAGKAPEPEMIVFTAENEDEVIESSAPTSVTPIIAAQTSDFSIVPLIIALLSSGYAIIALKRKREN